MITYVNSRSVLSTVYCLMYVVSHKLIYLCFNVFLHLFLEILCNQLADSEQKGVNLIAKDARQRLAALLLLLEMAYDEDSGCENSHIHMPKKDIAGAISVTQETVSRYLAEFKKKDFLCLQL